MTFDLCDTWLSLQFCRPASIWYWSRYPVFSVYRQLLWQKMLCCEPSVIIGRAVEWPLPPIYSRTPVRSWLGDNSLPGKCDRLHCTQISHRRAELYYLTHVVVKSRTVDTIFRLKRRRVLNREEKVLESSNLCKKLKILTSGSSWRGSNILTV